LKLDIGIVINNVATFNMDPITDLDESQVLQIFNVNMTAATSMTKRLLPILKRRAYKSALVFVGSEAGDHPKPDFPLHAATKVNFSTKL